MCAHQPSAKLETQMTLRHVPRRSNLGFLQCIDKSQLALIRCSPQAFFGRRSSRRQRVPRYPRPHRAGIVAPCVVLPDRIPNLLLSPVPGQQPHQRIEEREHRRGGLRELVAQHDGGADADRILAWINRGLGWWR